MEQGRATDSQAAAGSLTDCEFVAIGHDIKTRMATTRILSPSRQVRRSLYMRKTSSKAASRTMNLTGAGNRPQEGAGRRAAALSGEDRSKTNRERKSPVPSPRKKRVSPERDKRIDENQPIDVV